jgi:hypothetical protein
MLPRLWAGELTKVVADQPGEGLFQMSMGDELKARLWMPAAAKYRRRKNAEAARKLLGNLASINDACTNGLEDSKRKTST